MPLFRSTYVNNNERANELYRLLKHSGNSVFIIEKQQTTMSWFRQSYVFPINGTYETVDIRSLVAFISNTFLLFFNLV